MAKYFIDRPVLATVLAIVIVILGGVSIPTLPIANYPEVVPPVVQITAQYRGGNAQDLERTVTQPIEQQLVGLDGLLYFYSRSSNDGVLTIDVTFELGTDPDLATVKTENKVNLALPGLPEEVQREGVTVKKVSSGFLFALTFSSSDPRQDEVFLNNFVTINLLDRLGSIPGVGEARLGARQDYGMRVWVDPAKMANLGVTSTDISNAIRAQNRQNPAGSIGQSPAPAGTDFQYPVNAAGRMVEPEQFADIVVRGTPDGSLLRVRDVGRVELGAADYKSYSRTRGKEAAAVIIYLAPGANAVATGRAVRAFLEEARPTFPEGVDYGVAFDATRFVNASIADVIWTLLEAIALVAIVVFVFLQNWRATIIPLLAVPVSVIGTFALFPLLGFSINMTSLFGLVLAIGIVVDDAIVVVEAVQHKIDDGMSPRDATIQAMEEVSGPVVAIAFILAAVFIPVAFMGGIAGQIYQQFALTIAASVLISALNALTLSPAMSALLLRPKKASTGWVARGFAKFNSAFDWTTAKYSSGVRMLVRRSAFALVALAFCYFGAGVLFKVLPGGFLPNEDQGVFFAAVRLPDGASLERTRRVTAQAEEMLKDIPGIEVVTVLGGLDLTSGTNNTNVATLIALLKPWEERTSSHESLDGILGAAQQRFAGIEEALVFGFGLPPILGLGTTGGFEFMLQDRSGSGNIQELARVSQLVIEAAGKRPEIGMANTSFTTKVPQYKVNLNTDKAQTLGVPVTDVYDTLQTFLGGVYVNDFNRFGRTWRVMLQAEPKYRAAPDDINQFYVRRTASMETSVTMVTGVGNQAQRGSTNMVPLSTLVNLQSVSGPDVVYRYNRFPSAKIMGQNAPGYSSGEAAAAMEAAAKSAMPAGFDFEWTGTVFQERRSAGKEGIIFGLAAVLVVLFLAALYESWSIPFAVVLAVPLGLLGGLLGVYLRGYAYDVYTQIGLVTLIGLAAKNAILIVEYAKAGHESGKPLADAAVDAAHLRFRPILMTSVAFLLGVVPLVFASGAGAASRRALGTVVFGGMLTATALAVFIVPVLFVVIQRLTERGRPTHATIPASGPRLEGATS